MTTLDNATLTDTTIDFGPLLALRDELAQAPDGGFDGLCARIVAAIPKRSSQVKRSSPAKSGSSVT